MTAPKRIVGPLLPAPAAPGRLREQRNNPLPGMDGDPTMDRLVRLATALTGSPRAFVTLLPAERAVAHAGVPLRTDEGHVLGRLFIDGGPRARHDDGQDLLEDLASLAAHHLQHRADRDREQRLRRSAEETAEGLARLADAVSSLVDLAEEQEDPRLQRFAALCRNRTEEVLSRSRRLAETAAEVPPGSPDAPAPVDLRTVVTRGLRSVREAAGADTVRLEVEADPLAVRCDAVALERSVMHLITTALHHSQGHAPVTLRLAETAVRGAHGAPEQDRTTVASLTVVAEHSRISTGELARIVARFHEAMGEDPTGQGQEAAGIRISGGTVTVESGPVHGEVSPDGRLAVHVRWPLAAEPGAVRSAGRRPSGARR